MDRLSGAFGRFLDWLMGLACLLLFAMTLLIGGDVFTRNAGVGGIAWSNEVSENILYLITLFSAPWLLRQGQHIRVDILLRAIPAGVGWVLEWIGDLLGFACSVYFVWYGFKVLAASYQAGAINIKTLVTPEWWLLAPLPIAFLLVAIEFIFRMRRLAHGERAPRTDAVSVS
ncbi:MAG TPA: TRAP transporter small permease [Xanthobacteraceae bacterium]|jgi:TRAP-type transport system small permease protein|nr:TRAP transporter small permease [Xanthobacteraceae bacterium]